MTRGKARPAFSVESTWTFLGRGRGQSGGCEGGRTARLLAYHYIMRERVDGVVFVGKILCEGGSIKCVGQLTPAF
jgi:hypothetical protein